MLSLRDATPKVSPLPSAIVLSTNSTVCCWAQETAKQAFGAGISLMLTPQSPTPNAYTLAVSGRRPFVVVHSALLELLTPLEVQSVLGHELGHLKVGRTPSLAALIILEGIDRVQVLCPAVGLHGAWHSMAQRCRML
jgi:Peptidase family M48